MKKLVAMILAAVMVVALGGCAQSEDEKLAVAYNKYAKEYAAKGSEGTLKVAMSPDFSPMEFYDLSKSGDDAIVGFDVILAKYLATELNMTLEIKPMSFDACQAAVQTGSVDIGISGFSWTYERNQNFEISDFYVAGENETEQAIICTKANEGKWTKAEDFKGLKIGYQGASLQEVLVEETFKDMEGVDISGVYTDLGTAVEALKSGKIDALAVAKGNGDAIIASASDQVAFTGFEFDVDEKYKNNVCLLQKGNTALLEKINAALAKAKAADLYSGWYDACKVYSGISTLDELGFDENGEKLK